MGKYLRCILLAVSVLSVSLFDGKIVGNINDFNTADRIICRMDLAPEENLEEAEKSAQILRYPDAFWVEEDETVYLLDAYGKQVLEIKRKKIRTIPLSDSVLPADIICQGEHIYIYDDILSELQIYSKSGELLFSSPVTLDGDYVKRLEKTESGVVLLTYGGKEVSADMERGTLKVQKREEFLTVDKAAYDFAEVIGTDKKGNVYAVYTKLVENSSILYGELTLCSVSASGELIGGYVFPMEDYVYLPGTYVRVQEDGRVYLLVPTEGYIEVRRITLTEEYESNLPAISQTAKTLEAEYASDSKYRKQIGLACTEKMTLSRKEVRKRVDNMASYTWYLKRTHTLTSKSENVILPREIAFLKEEHSGEDSWKVKMTGLPYCWGGFYSPYGGFRGMTFEEAIEKKYVAGNINASGYYKYNTAGVDCSGYVSAAYGFDSKQSTSGLSDLGSKVTGVYKLQSMDMIVFPGEHIMLFCEWVDEGTILVSESTARDGKVITHPKSLNQLIVNGNYQMRSPW